MTTIERPISLPVITLDKVNKQEELFVAMPCVFKAVFTHAQLMNIRETFLKSLRGARHIDVALLISPDGNYYFRFSGLGVYSRWREHLALLTNQFVSSYRAGAIKTSIINPNNTDGCIIRLATYPLRADISISELTRHMSRLSHELRDFLGIDDITASFLLGGPSQSNEILLYSNSPQWARHVIGDIVWLINALYLRSLRYCMPKHYKSSSVYYAGEYSRIESLFLSQKVSLNARLSTQ